MLSLFLCFLLQSTSENGRREHGSRDCQTIQQIIHGNVIPPSNVDVVYIEFLMSHNSCLSFLCC